MGVFYGRYRLSHYGHDMGVPRHLLHAERDMKKFFTEFLGLLACTVLILSTAFILTYTAVVLTYGATWVTVKWFLT